MPQSNITNDAYGRNYQFHFGKIPNTSFQLTSCPLPTISMGQMLYPTPLHDIPMPGEKITFDPCTLEFVIDENFESYLELFRWIQDMRSGAATAKNTADLLSDATLTILTNNMLPILSFDFIGMFPTVLGEVNFTQQNGNDVAVGSCTFAYQEFNLRK